MMDIVGTTRIAVTSLAALLALQGTGLAGGKSKKKAPAHEQEQEAPAEPPPPPPEAPKPVEPAKPWAAGVSDADQADAIALYKEGNTEFAEQHYTEALAKYREAVKHWDHPQIRFNMTVCLINLDQPLEAYESLEVALKYGEAPLGPELYQQALNYRKLLLGQIGTLKVVCDEAGAVVTLDGAELLSCPGDASRRMPPGKHQLVATKDGFLPSTTPIVVLPGEETLIEVKLVPLSAATKMVRRWKKWKPWAVAGGGAGLLALGLLVELQSASDFDTYDREFADRCPDGCDPNDPMTQDLLDEIDGTRTRARIENVVAISFMTLGGVAIVGGLVGVFLNQPRAVLEKHDVTVQPTVAPGGAAVTVRVVF